MLLSNSRVRKCKAISGGIAIKINCAKNTGCFFEICLTFLQICKNNFQPNVLCKIDNEKQLMFTLSLVLTTTF